MNWTANYQADGDGLYVIGEYKYRHMAEQALRNFVARIPHPEVQIWWAWIEGPEGQRSTWEEIREEDALIAAGCPYDFNGGIL